ncbi:hypothetical protein ES703_64127 [subsurface metagenome]
MSSSNIADKLAQLQLSGAQWQILAAIYGSQLRQGNGEWQNQPCLMSFSGLKGATDVSPRHVARAVKDLLGRNILRRIPSGNTNLPNLFYFNSDYSTWVISKGTKPTPQVPSTASVPPLAETELTPQPLEPAPEPQAERIQAEFAIVYLSG